MAANRFGIDTHPVLPVVIPWSSISDSWGDKIAACLTRFEKTRCVRWHQGICSARSRRGSRHAAVERKAVRGVSQLFKMSARRLQCKCTTDTLPGLHHNENHSSARTPSTATRARPRQSAGHDIRAQWCETSRCKVTGDSNLVSGTARDPTLDALLLITKHMRATFGVCCRNPIAVHSSVK